MKTATEGALLDEVSRDAGIIEERPSAVWIAEDEGDVTKALERAIAAGTKVTPRGSGTGIPTQSVGRGVVLIQPDRKGIQLRGRTVVCEPALVKADLNRSLDGSGLWMPVDPSSFRACSVGGMAANNSSGTRTMKYGSTVDYVAGLGAAVPSAGYLRLSPIPEEEALAGDGLIGRLASLVAENRSLIRLEAPRVTKNSSGYRLEKALHDGLFDPARLLAGSEGTLGIMTSVTFSLTPKPAGRVLLVLEASLDELDPMASALRRHSPSALELVDKSVFKKAGKERRIAPYAKRDEQYLVFCEFDGTGPETADRLESVASDGRVSGAEPMVIEGEGAVSAAWDARNETLTIAAELRNGQKKLVPGLEDIVVPPDRLGDLVRMMTSLFESKGLEYISYGHAGDANLHMRPMLDVESEGGRRALHELMQASFEAAWRMGGSITGEHGDGRLRAPFVAQQYPKTFHLMKEVKRLCDPKGLLNPGVKIV